jgi:hypothetical protein
MVLILWSHVYTVTRSAALEFCVGSWHMCCRLLGQVGFCCPKGKVTRGLLGNIARTILTGSDLPVEPEGSISKKGCPSWRLHPETIEKGSEGSLG